MSSADNGSLPPLVGPKLKPFLERNAFVEFVRLLSCITPGKHGHVFEVKIAKKPYALKIFRFFDPEEELSSFDHLPDVPRDKLILQIDPFYAECRAYGCISAKGRNGKVAVRCYGHTTISADREAELAKRFNIIDWQRQEEEYDSPVTQRRPLRAIVKELVDNKVPFTDNMVTQMKNDLKALRRMFVYVRDVRADNYLGGKLVDFSSAWTAPHILVSTYLRSQESIDSDLQWDLEQFDEMIKNSGIQTWCRAAPNPEYLQKLRSYTQPRYESRS